MNYEEAKQRLFAKRPGIKRLLEGGEDLAFDISRWITRARIVRGWTQKQLAEKAGMSQPSLARVENGAYDPRIATIEKLAEALEYDANFVFTPREEKDEQPSPASSVPATREVSMIHHLRTGDIQWVRRPHRIYDISSSELADSEVVDRKEKTHKNTIKTT